MKKATLYLSVMLLLCNPLLCQDLARNFIGISAGIAPGISDLYIDIPFDYWPERKAGPIINIFYDRRLNESIRAGGFAEFERINYSDTASSEVFNIHRYSLGLNWVSQYPRAPLHMELGGYLGYGFMVAGNWDNLHGFGYGLILGPGYELRKIGFALHVHWGRYWYESTGIPVGVMDYTPKILVKAYFKLADF